MSAPVVLGLASPALVARVQDLATRALRGWSERWAQEAQVDAAAAEAALPAGGDANGQWFVERTDGGAGGVPATLWQPAALEVNLARTLYGALPSQLSADSLAMRSVRHLAQDLRRLLAQAWRVDEWVPAESAGTPCSRWHALVDVRVNVAGATLVARVPALRLRPAAVPARSEATLTRAQTLAAFATLPARATAVIGRAEISVAELANVQCGDVLLLDAALSEPLRIEIDGVASPVRAGLGVVGAQRAVQFVAPSRP